ncbi:MAG: hypothetical protein JXB32_15790 [Deltaproteobacteria bacterium]|nr:hypothetical protein [Deltaproteobacteria bacterium]
MRRRWLPGGGFVLLVASWSGLAAFLAWGLAEPDLDRAWWILSRTDRGAAELTAGDAEVLARCIERHPALARDRLGDKRLKHLARTSGGWSTAPTSHFLVLRGREAGLRVALEARGASSWPLTVEVSVGGAGCRLEYPQAGTQECVVPLPSSGAEERPVLGRLAASGGFATSDPEESVGLRFVEPGNGYGS